MSTGSTDTKVFGVNLLNETQTAEEKFTNLGVCVLQGDGFPNITVTKVRECIKSQLITCPSKFAICTKQGWQINLAQEDQLTLGHIITEEGCVLIQTIHEHPKIGVKDMTGTVIGFVFMSYNANLLSLKQSIIKQILQPQGIADLFQLLEGNKWPIGTVQENHMTVSEILIGSCVHTNITNKQTPQFSPPHSLLTKPKGLKQLSFKSSKDVCRVPETNGPSPTSNHKQVLLSYVSVESATNALHLKEELAAMGFSVYLDVHEIQSGVDWQDSLNFAVSECEVFVPLVTQKYGETLWTNREVKLADVLGKYILPVNFLGEWPPRCLAIQFATTQFIPWIPQDNNQNKSIRNRTKLQWDREDVKRVAMRISDRVNKLSVSTTPSLMRRATVVKSCPCVVEDNPLAITSDRKGKPLVMICVHPDQELFATELQMMFEKEPFEVWCTSDIDKKHLEYLDGLPSSQDGESYCNVVESCNDSEYLQAIRTFQDKADDASVVLFVLSQSFSTSRACQQQVFYCEHRKRVIPILYEEFKMPDWMSMLIGSSGLENKKDENFSSILIQRIKSLTDPVMRLKRTLSNQSHSPLSMKRKFPESYDELDSVANISPSNGDLSPVKRPSLSSMKTVLL